jgi:hypothetical protein
MRIDQTHRAWVVSILPIFTLALVVYIAYAHWSIGPVRGGSAIGLTFGIAGFGAMLYAVLLGLRKKFPIRRFGRASTWMRGHLWIGLLSFPLLLFHSGFAAKGTLTAWLTILLIATITTGVLGAAVQHYLPKIMTNLVPMETIYEEIPRVRKQLQREADELASELIRPAGAPDFVWGARPARSAVTVEPGIEPDSLSQVRAVYELTIRPFLADPDGVKNACSHPAQSAALFASLRAYVPASSHNALADLENICEEERQLNRQKLLYRCLHGWLLLHVPLSLALVVLGSIHAVVALEY